MEALPDDLEIDALVGALAESWAFDAATIEYAPVGFGSYHWIAADGTGARRFVTVDDLDRKPWLGDIRDPVFAGLTRAYETAMALRGAGLEFVVAPLPTHDAKAAHRLSDRYSISLVPFVGGEAGRFGAEETSERRETVIAILARLHRASTAVRSVARAVDLGLPGRGRLEEALRALDAPWSGGPYAEPARHLVATHATDVSELLGLFDRLGRDVAARSADWVVTHGEPHAGNLMWTQASPNLIDWDTVALAPPERDLWMRFAGTGDDADAYLEATGHRLDPIAMDFFRLMWDLGDLAAYVDVLRATHHDNEDTRKAYDGLMRRVGARAAWAELLE